MIQGFRARSQLLLMRYEEQDEVQCDVSDSSDSEDAQDDVARYFCYPSFSNLVVM